MITVKITDSIGYGTDGLILQVSGHSSEENGLEEKLQVCAAVSAMTRGLFHVCKARGNWTDGYIRFVIPPEHVHLMGYYATTLELIARAYGPKHLVVLRQSTRQF